MFAAVGGAGVIAEFVQEVVLLSNSLFTIAEKCRAGYLFSNSFSSGRCGLDAEVRPPFGTGKADYTI